MHDLVRTTELTLLLWKSPSFVWVQSLCSSLALQPLAAAWSLLLGSPGEKCTQKSLIYCYGYVKPIIVYLQNIWCCKVTTYPELSLCLPDADAGVVAVRAYYSTHRAHTHPALPTVDAVYLLVLLAPPGRNVLHGRNQRVILEDRRVQVGTQVLCTHGSSAHQTCLHSGLIPSLRAIMAGHRAGLFALRPGEDANKTWGSWSSSRIFGGYQRRLADMLYLRHITAWSWDPRRGIKVGGWGKFLWRCMNSCHLCVFLGGCKRRCITYVYFIGAVRVIQWDDFYWFKLVLLDWDVMWHISCRYGLAVRVVTWGCAITTLRARRLWVHYFIGCLHTSRLPRFIWEGSGGSLCVTGPLTGSFHSWSLCVRLLWYRCAGLSLPKKSVGEWGPPQYRVECVLFIITGWAYKNRIQTKQNWSEGRLTFTAILHKNTASSHWTICHWANDLLWLNGCCW